MNYQYAQMQVQEKPLVADSDCAVSSSTQDSTPTATMSRTRRGRKLEVVIIHHSIQRIFVCKEPFRNAMQKLTATENDYSISQGQIEMQTLVGKPHEQ